MPQNWKSSTRFAGAWRSVFACLCLTGAALLPAAAHADARSQAKRIHDRLAGVPPTEAVLTSMANDIAAGRETEAAYTAMQHRAFYDVTLKNFAMPWTNRDQTVFTPLNDYVATVIGMVRDDVAFDRVLYDDILYVGRSGLGVPGYSPSGNDHYAALESQGVSLKDDLVRTTQSAANGIPAEATAGVLTSRAAAQAFFVAGTNRAMFRFTLMNHLCTDLEQVQDPTRPPDRIRQDVSRSPGGDSRLFLNNCIACHSGMDPMTQAFAYYDYDETAGRMLYTPGSRAAEVLQQQGHVPGGLLDARRQLGQLLAQGQQLAAWLGRLAAGQGHRCEVARPRTLAQRRVRLLPGAEGVQERLFPRAERRAGPCARAGDDRQLQVQRLSAEASLRRSRHLLHGRLRGST